MEWYEMTDGETEKVLQTDRSSGLSQKEAEQRLKKVGFNELQQAEGKSAILVFLAQFKDFMVVVLLAATLISGLLGEYLDAITIMLIVLVNGILGYIQERKAEKSLKALKELSSPQMAVLREQNWVTIPAKEIVPGDIVKITSGDRVGADLRLLRTNGLHIEESALTGESVPVQKTINPIHGEDLPLGDRENMCFMGTMVTQGNGIGVVVNTGMNTEMGKIAHLIQTEETQLTPLQQRLEQLGKILIVVALLLTALVVVIGVYQGHDLYTMFLAGVSLAVAAIPEGLPAIVTIALAMGVQKMIRRKAIVRKLPSVETLGCATVICSDKTGTLTQNKMTVTQLWSEGRAWEVTATGDLQGCFYYNNKEINEQEQASLMQLLTFGSLCNNAEIKPTKKKKYTFNGDPTESALLVASYKAGITKESLIDQYEIVKEFPFDSTRKMMTVEVKAKNGKRFLVTKGAPDVVLGLCETVLWEGRQQLLKDRHQQQISQTIASMGQDALRTIAIAYRTLQEAEDIGTASEAERKLTFIGLQGMIDPPREEVAHSILQCHKAGIKTIMITGDHVITAKAIADQLGILPKNGKVMDGKTLSNMTVDELSEIVEDIYVFARVSPEHKLKIVKALQKNGHIVAMTGDGVNDAPAIKAANIGVAMGKTGTDVAKEASSLVLSDDNFATIQAAIEEGRNIYENIRKFIRYLLASNVGEILVMLFAMILSLPLPLVPIQILWVNLVTDGLPAMALGVDSAEDNVMNRPPRKSNEGIFARGLGWKIVTRGIMIGTVSLLAFLFVYIENPNDLVLAQTVAFSTLVLAQLIHVFDCRSERSVFHRNPFENMYLVWAVISSIILLLVVIYFEPLQPVFHTTALAFREWLLIIVMSAIPTFALAGFSLYKKSKVNTKKYA
jgi:P-type Ca2+ transporter type 2C